MDSKKFKQAVDLLSKEKGIDEDIIYDDECKIQISNEFFTKSTAC